MSSVNKNRSRLKHDKNPTPKTKTEREDEKEKKKVRQKKSLVDAKIRERVETSSLDMDNEYPIVFSKNVLEIEGGSVKLETEFKGNDSTQVILYLNGQQCRGTDENFHPEIIYSEEKKLCLVRIIIKEANTTNSGTYTVFLVNDKKRIIVDYHIKIDEQFEKPWLTNQPECIQIPDESLKLKFGIRSFREFTTKWTLNDKSIELTESNQKYKETIERGENDRYTINLDINYPLSIENSGRYECEVVAGQFSLHTSFNVELEDNKPSLTKEPTIQLETAGSDAPILILTVEYNSKQNASVLWNGRRGQLMNDHTIMTKSTNVSGNFITQLRLQNCKAEHSGIYDCRIENESGSFVAELDVEIEDSASGKENNKK